MLNYGYLYLYIMKGNGKIFMNTLHFNRFVSYFQVIVYIFITHKNA
jgi:hypothetical protein